MRVAVTVHPHAGREELRWDGRELRLSITQPPAEGAANAAALRLVAAWLQVPPSRVRLVAGRRSRHKLVEIEGIDALPSASEHRSV
jgi:hypothetical protein